jgi:hypothetical protein
MPEPMTDDQIRAIIEDYDKAAENLLEQRDARLRDALASGRKQADIVRASGLARETVRQALNPEIRAAVKKAAAERRAAKKTAPRD